MEKIIERSIEEEMKQSYLDYAMSVIVGRALPNVNDGLKPVHRRVLYSMYELGVFHNKPFKKCARIVGDCLGKYHPHGDSAVYDALVRMAQPFSLRYPLVEGHGNFGSIDGDSPAAMRYTEARLSKISEEMLEDLEKETVEFIPNFDGSLKEPVELPSKFPNLLVNGSSGIAVGMATNIPPHNLNEICDAIVFVIDNPESEKEELLKIIKGPDFPTGASIKGISGIREYLMNGIGKVTIKSKTDIEEDKKKKKIIIKEIPYQVNKTKLVEDIASLVKNGTIHEISDLRDESNREGIRIVIELKQNTNEEIVLNKLYKHTQLQTTFGIQMLALDGQKPKIFNIRQLIDTYISYRDKIIQKKTNFELNKAENRLHIIQGLIIALKNIDEVIKIIKSSENIESARNQLITKFSISEEQSNAILDMKLQRLTQLEQEKLNQESSNLEQKISELKKILQSREERLNIIKNEIFDLKSKYGDERRTEIENSEEVEIEIEDLIPEKPWIVVVTNDDYLKRMNIDEFKVQRRGGKGILGAKTKEEDIIKKVFISSSKEHVLFFTNKGLVKKIKTYMIPEGTRTSKGKPLLNLIKLEEDEKVTSIFPVKDFENGYLIFLTKKGLIKKTSLKAFSNLRQTGIIAIKLRKNDQVIAVEYCNPDDDIMIFTKKGQAIKFSERRIRETGRNSYGVKGITLSEGDETVSLEIINENTNILTITSNGLGKITKAKEYRITNRGGKGIRNIRLNKGDHVIGTLKINNNEEILVFTEQGIVIRTKSIEIPTHGRNSKGVKVIRLNENDRVSSITNIQEQTEI